VATYTVPQSQRPYTWTAIVQLTENTRVFLQCFSQFSQKAHVSRRTHNHTKTSRKHNQLWQGMSRQRRGGDQQRYRQAHRRRPCKHTRKQTTQHTHKPTKRETGVSGRGLGNPATTTDTQTRVTTIHFASSTTHTKCK